MRVIVSALVLLLLLAAGCFSTADAQTTIGLAATWVANHSFGTFSAPSAGIDSIVSVQQVGNSMGGMVVFSNNSRIYGRNSTTGAVEFVWKPPEGGSQDGTGPTVVADALFPIFHPNILIFKSYSVQHNKDWYWGYDILKKTTVWNVSVCNTIDSYPKCWAMLTATDQFAIIWEAGRKVMQIDAGTGQVYAEASFNGKVISERNSHGWAAANKEVVQSYYTPGIFYTKTQTPNALNRYDYHFFNLIKYPTAESSAGVIGSSC